MKVKDAQRFNIRLNLLCISAGYLAVSIVLLFFPKVSLADLCHTMGIVMVIWGLFNIAVYFIRRQFLIPNHIGFSAGVAAALIGCFAILNTLEFERIFSQLLALSVLSDSILKLQFSMDLLRMKSRKWWLILLAALLTAVLAMIILINPFHVSRSRELFTYLVLMADGIVNILVIIYLSLQTKAYFKEHPLPAVIEEK